MHSDQSSFKDSQAHCAYENISEWSALQFVIINAKWQLVYDIFSIHSQLDYSEKLLLFPAAASRCSVKFILDFHTIINLLVGLQIFFKFF